MTISALVRDHAPEGGTAPGLSFPCVRTDSPLPDVERAAILANPGFGKHFTDHMASAEWTVEAGWHDGRVGGVQPFTMHPGSAVLHYGQEIFEGLKAYRHPDDSIWLFRPERNARRFAASARRLALPEVPADAFLTAVAGLVEADQDWVPAHGNEASLYLRPFEIATEVFMGVRPSREARFAVLASPAGPYFSAGIQGIKLWVTTEFTRAAPGGTGQAKCGGNYAGSLVAQVEAQGRGCDQVLYTGGTPECPTLDESGTMNLMLVTVDGQLLTPGLGTILDGVTRDSVLALAADHGLTPVEREIPLAELLDRCRDGSVTEVFAAGTAAVITPITGLAGEGYEVRVGSGEPGPTAAAIREHLLGIQFGNLAAPPGWMTRVV